MSMNMHSATLVAIMSLVTIGLRFLPFIVFPQNKPVPVIVTRLSTVLPMAVMGMLVVYCFRNSSIMLAPFMAPEIIASVTVVGSYAWKKNTFLSLILGTILYMILIRVL